MPNISMSLSANYVTATSSYQRLLVGKRLTDRRITQLKKEGWFGGEKDKQRKEKISRKKRNKSVFKSIMRDFGL